MPNFPEFWYKFLLKKIIHYLLLKHYKIKILCIYIKLFQLVYKKLYKKTLPPSVKPKGYQYKDNLGWPLA